jgi:serine/threonine-protein kinase
VVCPKTQQRVAGILADGTVIDEKYKIQGVLGTGGMAAVYRAEHVKIGRIVALKLLLPEFVAYPDLVQRVEREARAAGGIDHANVVEIVDLGTTAEFGPYIAMEMLKGEDLATYVEQRGNRLDDIEAADVARQVLGALSAAHAKGVIHRDLKPENIFLAEEEDRRRVKVLDFGISKLNESGGAVTSLTRTGTVMGTPQYMAPEQAAGARDQDHRVDIYACGVVLYAILTGGLPYEAENYNLLINDILNKPPIAILARDKGIDRDLADIVMKSIARNPADRYQTAKEMQDVLIEWLQDNSIGSTGVRQRLSDSIRQRIPSAVPVPVNTHPPLDVIERDGRKSRKSITDDEPTTAIETGDRPRTSPGLRTAPTMPDPLEAAKTGNAPTVLAGANSGSLRADTRTPLGWENTPAGTKLPPPERPDGGAFKWFVLTLLLVGGGGFAVRQFAPAQWNTAVNSAGVPQFAVVTGAGNGASANNTGDAGAVETPRNGHSASNTGRNGSNSQNAANAHTPPANNATNTAPNTATADSGAPATNDVEQPPAQATTNNTTPAPTVNRTSHPAVQRNAHPGHVIRRPVRNVRRPARRPTIRRR